MDWDFSHLDNRWESESLDWNYSEIVKSYLKPTDALLDIGTGGGEFLLTLNHPYKLTSITEAYLPNYKLCEERLSPLGIKVKQAYDNILPFADNTFDIIINRHSSFDINEVNRVLKNGGYFITQQVGNKNNSELQAKLLNNYKSNTDKKHTLNNYIKILRQMNYSIKISDEQFQQVKFFDIGAIVYYAKIIQWEFPGFSVDTHFDKFCNLQTEIEQDGYVLSNWHRFIIAAKKII